MKIGIVTVYETMNNLGSFLQAYALKTFLEESGHEVVFVEDKSILQEVKKCCFKLNPKREFFLRIKKCIKFLNALKELKTVKKSQINNLDYIIYGSDEIWNMDNPSFKNKFYFGTDITVQKKIAYAISVGAMQQKTLTENMGIANGIFSFDEILVRDAHTKNMLENILEKPLKYACDPTMIVPLEKLERPIKCPKEKYLFVYTYGIDEPMDSIIVRFAKEHNLKIVSACFWHLWCDEIIECSPLQFSSLIKNAEYVFTTTFHGAIFTMLNHKKCCILPIREKVKDVVTRMGIAERLIDENISYEDFCKVMKQDFPVQVFENTLKEYRANSQKLLTEALK